MDRTVPDCLVTGFEELIDSLELPDPEDRHILAAAIRSRAGVIVTYNVNDFPGEILDGYGIEVQHPDEFVTHLYDLSPGAVCRAVRNQRLALKNPLVSTSELLNTFLSPGACNHRGTSSVDGRVTVGASYIALALQPTHCFADRPPIDAQPPSDIRERHSKLTELRCLYSDLLIQRRIPGFGDRDFYLH
jgi:hypothetical protein